jgi:hypothetical protein
MIHLKELIMPVVIQYVVERDGEAKMTFASKQQADAYDKMLDLAEMMQDIIGRSDLLGESQTEALSLYLAQQKDELLLALQGKAKTVKKAKEEQAAEPEQRTSEAESAAVTELSYAA